MDQAYSSSFLLFLLGEPVSRFHSNCTIGSVLHLVSIVTDSKHPLHILANTCYSLSLDCGRPDTWEVISPGWFNFLKGSVFVFVCVVGT